MKTVIRRNVFETNSSSTHSLTFSSDAPKNYTFECSSPWARLFMLKALSNCAHQKYEIMSRDLDIEPDEYDEFEDEEMVDDVSDQIVDEQTEEKTGTDEEEYDYFDDLEGSLENQEKMLGILDKLVQKCEEVVCERENANKENFFERMVDEYFCPGGNEKQKKRCVKYLQDNYDRPGEELCETSFENGTLDLCTCGYDSVDSLLLATSKGDYLDESDLYGRAVEYLYGKKRFFATEYYSGCCLINSKNKL